MIGNHDERAPYAKGLFGSDDDGPQDRVYDVGGLRIVALDTSVPDTTTARCCPSSSTGSRRPEHARRARHHPGDAPCADPGADAGAGRDHRAVDQDRLAEVVEGSDVRQILGGHFHYTSHSTFAGIPVSIASASCYTTDPAPPDRLISGVDGHQAFTMAHVCIDRIVHTVVPLPEAPEVTATRPRCAKPRMHSPPGAPRYFQPQGLRLQQSDRVARASGTADRPLRRGCATLGA